MKLVFAMLADSATTSQDGKVSIQGGGINTVSAPTFPAIHPTLALVVKLDGDGSDRPETATTLVVEGRTPQGDLLFQGTSAPIQWRPSDSQGRPANYTFVITVPMLVLPTEGRYTFRVLLGNQELISLPLYAELGPQAPAQSDTQ